MNTILKFDDPTKDTQGVFDWNAKHIKGEDERIEIRKIFEGVKMIIIVYKKPYQPRKPEFPEYDGGGKDFYWEQANILYSGDCARYKKRHQDIRISMNGKINLTWNDYENMQDAIEEALEFLL
jgi:hypothetical protein